MCCMYLEMKTRLQCVAFVIRSVNTYKKFLCGVSCLNDSSDNKTFSTSLLIQVIDL